jgi:hypothetical protein
MHFLLPRASSRKHVMHQGARNFCYTHTACHAEQETQRVKLGEAACEFCNAQEVTKLRGGKRFGAFGFRAFLRNTLVFEPCYAREIDGRSFPV